MSLCVRGPNLKPCFFYSFLTSPDLLSFWLRQKGLQRSAFFLLPRACCPLSGTFNRSSSLSRNFTFITVSLSFSRVGKALLARAGYKDLRWPPPHPNFYGPAGRVLFFRSAATCFSRSFLRVVPARSLYVFLACWSPFPACRRRVPSRQYLSACPPTNRFRLYPISRSAS